MNEPRKLTPAERGRLGGLAAGHNLTPDERKRRAAKGGQATLEKHGKALYVRLNHRKAGRLEGPIIK